MSKPELTCDNCGRFVPQLESASLRENELRESNADLLAALEKLADVLPILGAPGSPIARALMQARAAIAQAKE